MAPQLLRRPGFVVHEAESVHGGSSMVGAWSVSRQRLSRSLFQSAGSPGAQPSFGTTTLQQARVHPGIIVAVVVVALLALLAAILIVKKYCFPESNVSYRYSVLRSRQEELDNSTTNRLQDDSDEDLLD